jgi:hypothetical protein
MKSEWVRHRRIATDVFQIETGSPERKVVARASEGT